MIPASLKNLLNATQGQRSTHWEGREVVLFNTTWGELAISLQGAQVLHFLPRGAAKENSAWLWLTPTPKALPGAIRGGIPLCWPWFGDERYADETPDRSGPFHGLARSASWRLEAVDEHDEGIEAHLSPTLPLHSQLTARVVVQANAQRLHVELISENIGHEPLKVSGALHSYLAVSDAHQCRLEGLAGARYLDKLKGFSESKQQGTLAIRGAIDRIYHSNQALLLNDGQRSLRIGKQSSDSTVVWHPADDLPADIPADAGRHFLCVEAANTRLDPVWLVPDAQHLLGTTLSLG